MVINKLKKWRKGKSRKARIIKEGDCKIKHVFGKGDLMKAALSFDLAKKFQCLRCKDWITYSEILAFVAKEEGIDLNDKAGLFKRNQDIIEDQKKDKS